MLKPVMLYLLLRLMLMVMTVSGHARPLYSIPGYMARKYAPELRFDSKQGRENLCFPSSASDYYNERAQNHVQRICNTDYSTITSGSVPTYWKQTCCGENLHIAYWFFYGYQDSCFPGVGSHDADWEHIIVKVENYKSNRDMKLGAVMFYQHGGRYTRKPGHYEVDGTHPVVYIGKTAHGSYHDDGGTGGCLYFEDFRNPDPSNKYMKTWLNLEKLRRNDPSAPKFMQDKNAKEKFNNIPSPLERNEIEHLCTQKGCFGHCYFLGVEIGTGKIKQPCGCYKTQIGDNEYF